jgi:hypothetical protein
MPWLYIWFGLAMLEAALILWLVAQCLRLSDEKWSARQWRLLALETRETASLLHRRAGRLARALRKISNLETPKAAHAAKRMAKIAKEALGQ